MIREALDHIPTGVRWTLDAVSLGAVVGTVTEYLPPIAAATAITWHLLQMSESKRVIQLAKAVGRVATAIAANPALLSLIQWVSSTRVMTAIGDALVRVFRRAPTQPGDEPKN